MHAELAVRLTIFKFCLSSCLSPCCWIVFVVSVYFDFLATLSVVVAGIVTRPEDMFRSLTTASPYLCVLLVAVEALHLAHLMASHGYFFPIDDHMLTVKNDNTYYRFQVSSITSHHLTLYNVRWGHSFSHYLFTALFRVGSRCCLPNLCTWLSAIEPRWPHHSIW